MCFVCVGWWLESHVFCLCRVVAGKPCVLFLLGGGWKAMCFCLCRVVAGMPYGLKNFVLFVAFWLSKTQPESHSRTSYHV